ncbi:hypothetical protein GCM10019016_127160 [Streptomyces prasinosporus]|uniref:Uncharacterized protein n=1 Tax=Streptomyces prasinosporus TaxID=68256 RepID=A0ABP6UFX8_9ACTN
MRVRDTQVMDPGTAAILGGAVGALVTGTAALASAWLRARAVRQQTTAQRLQADQQREFEQARARREARSKAYADLIDLTQVVGTTVLEMIRSESYDEDGVRRVLDQLGELLSRSARVQFEGPVSLIASTHAIVQAVIACRKTLMAIAVLPGAPPGLRGEPRTALTRRCRADLKMRGGALDGFVKEARGVLGSELFPSSV